MSSHEILTRNLDSIGLPITIRCEPVINGATDETGRRISIVKYNGETERSQHISCTVTEGRNILRINFGPSKIFDDSRLIRTFTEIESSCNNGLANIKNLLGQLPWREPREPSLSGKDRANLADLRRKKSHKHIREH